MIAHEADGRHDSPAPPSWFARALAEEPECGATVVDGVSISHRAWGQAGHPGVVLIHGGLAHSRWWDHVAPLLTAGGARRVVALDLSGHGDSARRPRYDFELWAGEVLGVVGRAGIAGPPVVVGHSMGGLVALSAGLAAPDRIGGVVAIDCPLTERTPEERAATERRALGDVRTYRTRAAGLARFRPVPDQPALPYVRAHLADTSLRPCADGWTWKYDARVFGGQDFDPGALADLRGRVALFRAEYGMLRADVGALFRSARCVWDLEIPHAGHHVMLDQPLALVTALRAVLASWQPIG